MIKHDSGKIWRDSGTTVTKILHQQDIEIEFPDFKFS